MFFVLSSTTEFFLLKGVDRQNGEQMHALRSLIHLFLLRQVVTMSQTDGHAMYSCSARGHETLFEVEVPCSNVSHVTFFIALGGVFYLPIKICVVSQPRSLENVVKAEAGAKDVEDRRHWTPDYCPYSREVRAKLRNCGTKEACREVWRYIQYNINRRRNKYHQFCSSSCCGHTPSLAGMCERFMLYVQLWERFAGYQPHRRC